MGTNELSLLRGQSAVESTRGTDLPATRKNYAQFTPQYVRPLSAFQDTTGTFHARRRPVYAREKPGGTFLDLATFEDLPWWLLQGVKGGVTGTGDGGTPIAYTYSFVPTLATDDLASITHEFNDVGNPYQISQLMCNQFTLRGDSDNDSEPGWMIDVESKGRDWTTTTFTGSLTDRTTEVITARGTKLYIDDAGGTIGSTQITGRLISWSITVNNNINFKAFAEDVTYVAANKVGRGVVELDLQLTFEFDTDLEFAKYRATAPAQRMIRFERSSAAAIHTTVFKRLRTDIYAYYSSWSRGARESNTTMTLGAMAFFDATAAKAFSFEVVNALITLP